MEDWFFQGVQVKLRHSKLPVFYYQNRIVEKNEAQRKVETFQALGSRQIRIKYNALNISPPVVVS